MEKWAISENLCTCFGVKNFNLFTDLINLVMKEFERTFGVSMIHRYPILIDNATAGSGYTPIITPVLDLILVIKLSVEDGLYTSKIIFQFAHEMMHVLFFTMFGLNKGPASVREEAICTAASLCLIAEFKWDELAAYIEYLEAMKNEGYRQGVPLAIECGFDLESLKDKYFEYVEAKLLNE